MTYDHTQLNPADPLFAAGPPPLPPRDADGFAIYDDDPEAEWAAYEAERAAARKPSRVARKANRPACVPEPPLPPEREVGFPTGSAPACQPGLDERTTRVDGWTLAKQRRFCEILTETGVVTQACSEVGMSRQSAYVFRETIRGRAFASLWDESRNKALNAVVDDAVTFTLSGQTSFDLEEGETVRERNVRSPKRLLGTIERLRSEALLGNARTMAASRNFEACLDQLLVGQVYHDRQHPPIAIPALPPQSAQDRMEPNPSLYYRRWTPAHQHKFCLALIQHGNVERACAYAGRGRTGAYTLRNRAEGKAFALAWDAALLVVSKQMMDTAIEMAREGAIEELVRKGRPTRWRHSTSPEMALETVARLRRLKAREDALYGDGYARMGCAADHGVALEWLESGEALKAIEAAERLIPQG